MIETNWTQEKKKKRKKEMENEAMRGKLSKAIRGAAEWGHKGVAD